MGKFESTSRAYSLLNLLNFKNLMKYFVLISMFRYVKKFPENQVFKLIQNTHNTRGNNVNFQCPQFRTKLFDNSVLCAGPQLWNSLPLDIKNIINNSNLSQFKRKAKQYLLNCQNS